MIKRISDIVQKWAFDELDHLAESDFPEFIESPTNSIESLCPFDGGSVCSRQLARLWKLLSKLHIVEPIFQQFVVQRLLESSKEHDFEFVSEDKAELLQTGRAILQDGEIVAALATSTVLPKATTLSLIYPLKEGSDEHTLNFMKNESRQVVVATGKELIEYYPRQQFSACG